MLLIVLERTNLRTQHIWYFAELRRQVKLLIGVSLYINQMTMKSPTTSFGKPQIAI